MGLLDDAIREHLDLKRRRGADPTEVERDERDALGPVRRAPESAPGSDSVLEDADYDAEVDGPEGVESAPASVPALDPEAGSWSYEDAQAENLDPEDVDPESTGPEPAAPEPAAPEPAAPEPAAPEPPAATPPPPHPSGAETAEYDVEAALDAEPQRPDAAGEDVLEETPEFLQDTPDHDRLWFEQRPPKDFDFDG